MSTPSCGYICFNNFRKAAGVRMAGRLISTFAKSLSPGTEFGKRIPDINTLASHIIRVGILISRQMFDIRFAFPDESRQ